MALRKDWKEQIAPTGINGAAPWDAELIDAIVEADIPGVARLFSNWRQSGVNVKNVAGLVSAYFEFSPRLTDVLASAVDMAAKPSRHAYHNNTHFLETFVLAATLGCRARQNKTLGHDHFALLLTAALVHDYKHDGKGNKGIPLRLEAMAADHALPILMKAGLTQDEATLVRAFIYTTDITRDYTDPASYSTADRVKKYSLTANTEYLTPDLMVLHETGMANTALMLEDADLGTSHISAGLCRENSEAIAREQGVEYKPEQTVFFLNNISFGRAFSREGREIIGPYIPAVLHAFGIEQRRAFVETAPQPPSPF